MSNEGIEVKFKAKPITVFGVALIWSSMAFGIGGIVVPSFFPWIKAETQIVNLTPAPTAQSLKDTALRGTLTKSNTHPFNFYLITASTEAVTLKVPAIFNLTLLVGKRILAVGSYDSKNKILEVQDIQDLEVLSKSPVPIPTVIPTPVPTVEPTIVPTETPIDLDI